MRAAYEIGLKIANLKKRAANLQDLLDTSGIGNRPLLRPGHRSLVLLQIDGCHRDIITLEWVLGKFEC
jgi:hypothetical protein